MRATVVSLLLVSACFAEQQEQREDKKAPPPTDPLTREQVAAKVSALLKPSNDPSEWCKTPQIGLILAQESQPVQKPEPRPKTAPPK